MKKKVLLSLSILLAMAVTGCNTSYSSEQKPTGGPGDGAPSNPSNSQSSSASSSNSASSIETIDDGDYIPDVNDEFIYFITNDTLEKGEYDSEKDEYTFSITGDNWEQIYVNTPEKTIILELNETTITDYKNSPIFVQDCEKIEISAKKNTVNRIVDHRDMMTVNYTTQGTGAIYVNNGDLKLKGAGEMIVESTYYNGIHCKDDIKIQKQDLTVIAVAHGIRGNDSITITSGTIDISCGGDGLHTSNSEISSKANQKGNVTINGGTLTINSWGDAIAAAYDAIFQEADGETISATLKTNKYSSYDGEVAVTSSNNFYLKMSSSVYSNGGYTYAAYINERWYPATYKGTQSNQGGGMPPMRAPNDRPGQSSTYYIYELEKPSGASSFTLYRFQGSGVTDFSTTSYNAVSDVKAFNDNYDMVQINSISSGKISFGSWGNYSSGNNNGADVSAKGIKADNAISIVSGTIDIKAYDDAIHANNDEPLDEEDAEPLGNINISGGNLTLYASDDGVHADGTLTISGGQTNVTYSYEGLEGNVINITGGESFVYGTDDGVNATAGNKSPAINVSGGLLDVEVSTSGDTDGIDSNGTLNITGGAVIVKGPGTAGQTGSPAAAVDTDGAITISAGSLIVFGGIERNPTSSVTRTLISSSSIAAGSHTISFASQSYTTTLKSNCKGCIISKVIIT